jgi:CheY-like chemotaxis protein
MSPSRRCPRSSATSFCPWYDARVTTETILPRVFVNVVGFTDVERHALNTLFRLSEGRAQGLPAYGLWAPGAPAPMRLALLDSASTAAHAALAELGHQAGVSIIWVDGAITPANAWRVFVRPIRWPDVLQALDDLFAPKPSLDLDLVSGETAAWGDEIPLSAPKRALVMDADIEARLYMRTKLGAHGISLVDDAVDAAQALALLGQTSSYQFVSIDVLSADGDPWDIAKAATATQATVLLTSHGNSPLLRTHAWFAQCSACLQKPLEPDALNDLLRKI